MSTHRAYHGEACCVIDFSSSSTTSQPFEIERSKKVSYLASFLCCREEGDEWKMNNNCWVLRSPFTGVVSS
jgi:hypothetical protein